MTHGERSIVHIGDFCISLPAYTKQATIIQPTNDGRLQQWYYRDGHVYQAGKPCDGLAFATTEDDDEQVVMVVNDWSEAR